MQLKKHHNTMAGVNPPPQIQCIVVVVEHGTHHYKIIEKTKRITALTRSNGKWVARSSVALIKGDRIHIVVHCRKGAAGEGPHATAVVGEELIGQRISEEGKGGGVEDNVRERG